MSQRVDDETLRQLLLHARNVGASNAVISGLTLEMIITELRQRREDDTQTSMCASCYGTGEVVAAISRYGAPSKCTQCGGAGRVRR